MAADGAGAMRAAPWVGRKLRARCWMLQRIIILMAVAVLLGGCSGGDAAVEEGTDRASAAAGEVATADDGASGQTSMTGEAANGAGTAGEVGSAEASDAQVPETSEGSNDSHIEEEVDEPPTEEWEEEPVAGDDLAPAVNSHLRVLRAYVCKGIEQGEPTEAGKSFVPEDGGLRLCCFSEIYGAQAPDVVYHVWRWGDREMARVELPVESPRWRTWSSKRILDEWRGEWHVDITDAEGVVLSRLDFSVE